MRKLLRYRWIGPLLATLLLAGALDAAAAQGHSLARALGVGEVLEAPDGTARDTVSDPLPWFALSVPASDDAVDSVPAAQRNRPRLASDAASRTLASPAEPGTSTVPLRHLLCVYRL